MTEASARTVLLVKAIEQNDAKAELISHHTRHEASRQALAGTKPPPSVADSAQQTPSEEFLVRRAEFLLERVRSTHPSVQSVLATTVGRAWLGPVILGGALILGLATNALGPEQRISILAAPLWGMIAWNLVVYALLVIGCARRRARVAEPHPTHPLIAIVQRWTLPAWPEHQESTPALTRGLRRFGQEWVQLSAPLHLARARRLLHLSAALLAGGAVAGMYWRGLVFEYLAGWASTFLNAEQLHPILVVLLGPASLISGIELPSIEHLRAIRWPDAENAAPWIHLYAVSAALYIVVPRSLLALAETFRARRLSREFPLALDDPYYRRLSGQRQPLLSDSAWIVPCGLELQPRQMETFREFLYELFGHNATLRFENPIAYGDEDQFLERARQQSAELPAQFLVLFNMAATPESEHHGQLLHGLKSLLGSADRRLVPLLDESNYRRRLRGQTESEQQIDKRRKTWQRLTRDHQLPLVTLDLDAPQPDYWYEQLRQALGAPQPSAA